MMMTLFIVSTLLLLYVYFGYPLLLGALARLFPKPHQIDESLEPSVTLIISAYNEEKVIRAKIENALGLDYPVDRLTIMVVSDGSTDRTDEIVRELSGRGVALVRPPERRGKTAGLNVALGQVESEVVIFSDANALYDPAALRKMVRHFADPQVGYVVGHARYEDIANAAGSSEGAYWGFEVRLKKWESDFSSVVGGDGAIYAIRRELYEPMRETDINDFVNPLQIVAKGHRGIFDPEAFCWEKPSEEFQKEFGRKVRIVNRSFNGLLRVASVCNPLRTGRFAWQVISHKLMRWFSPVLLLLQCAASMGMLIENPHNLLAQGVSALYASGALLALVGWQLDRMGRESLTVFYFPYYFALMNSASIAGIWLRLRGKVITRWETVRGEAIARTRFHPVVPALFLGLCSLTFLGNRWLAGHFGEAQVVQASAFGLMAVLVYTYLGYPLLLAGLARLQPLSVDRDDDYLPSVTLLIAAFNEAQVIEEKIHNSLALDYPADRLRVLIASDGSTDNTNQIVSRYADRGVELLAFPANRGKISALNEAMKGINSDIVIFSDANVCYRPDAVKKLARNFNDPRIGVVSGRVVLESDGVSYGSAEKGYYRIEHPIQKNEGSMGALAGADGAMYAIRPSLYVAPPVDTILDDLVIPMAVARQGFLAIHEPEALGYEKNLAEVSSEFRRKARIMAGGFQALLSGNGVPGLSQWLLLFTFFSHKVLRWFSGPLMVLLLLLLIHVHLSAPLILLDLTLFLLILGLLVFFAANLIPSFRSHRPVNLVHYLFMLNAASLFGLYLGLTRQQKTTWRGGVQ